MILPWVLTCVGLTILLLAGDALVRGAVNLSLRVGIPALIVSLTIVAFGTSAPELLIGISAVIEGKPGLALGNVVGSNTANILLVLGLPALLSRMHTSRFDTRRSYWMMLAASVGFIALAFLGTLTWITGVILLCGMALVLWDQTRSARAHVAQSRGEEIADLEGADPDMPWWQIGLFLALGLVGLPFGADLLVENASIIARDFGVSDAVIGLTLVAIGTSLPELAKEDRFAIHDEMCRVLAAIHGVDLEATGLGLGGRDPRQATDPIVHGDLSLHSVLLSPLGRVKLLPFACTAPAPHTATTVPVGHAGVPMHVAPEVLAGGPSTPSSDLWSLGHVLYELLAPSLPDGFDQGRAPMGWWRLGLLPPLAELRRDVPAEISHLAVHLLDADPGKRLASAEAVEEELLWALTNHGERTIPRLGDDDEPVERFPEDAITEHASRPWSSATAARLGPDPDDATISTEYLAAEADTEEVPLLGDPAAHQTEPIGVLEVPTSPHHGLQLIGAPMAPDASAFTNTDMNIEPLREVARAQGRRPPLVPDRDLWLEPEANPVYIDSLEMEAPADESLEDLPAPSRPEVARPTPAATEASTPVHDAAPAPRPRREAPARAARSETAALYYLIGTSLLFLAAVVMAVALFATR